jgi:hypothetical protein
LFRPQSEADEQALPALLSEGEIADLSQLPASIPAYLIHVVPEQVSKSNDPSDPKPEAISAVKALQKATAQGRQSTRSPGSIWTVPCRISTTMGHRW